MDKAIVLPSPVLTWRRTSAVVMGAALVAAASQLAVPLPGTPVPLTLQPLAVLIVGGLLGPWLGASSLLFYLALGAAGLPVFTPIGLPGVARLIGPTGGYLLAYPLAAYAVGTLSSGQAGRAPGSLRLAVAALAGLVLIYLGGLVQLWVYAGNIRAAARFGTLPFLVGDLIKLGVAVLLLHLTIRPVRARL